MEKKTITAVTAEMKATIKNNTAFALPNSPSALGWRPDEIKEKFWRAIIGEEGSVMVELERVITEANGLFSEIYKTEADNEQRLKNSIVAVKYDAATGVLSFEHDDGSVSSQDLPLELIVKSGEYDEVNNRIVLTLANGDKISIDATKLLGEFVGDGESIEKTVSGNKYSFRLRPELLETIRREDGARAALAAHEERENAHGIPAQLSRAVFEHNANSGAHPEIGYRLSVLESANELISSLVGIKYEYLTDGSSSAVKSPPEGAMTNALLSEVHAEAVIEDVFCDLTAQSGEKIVFENKGNYSTTMLLTKNKNFNLDGILYAATGAQAETRLDIEFSGLIRRVSSNGDGPFIGFEHRYSDTYSNMGAFSLEVDLSEITAKSWFRCVCKDGTGRHFVLFSTTEDGRVLIFGRHSVALEFGYKLRLTLSADMSRARVYNSTEDGFYKEFSADISYAHLNFEEWKAGMTESVCLVQWRFCGAGTIEFSKLNIYDGEVWEIRPTLKLAYPTEIVSAHRSLQISDRIKALCLEYSGIEGCSSYVDLLNRRFVIKTKVRAAQPGDAIREGAMLTDGKKTVVALDTQEYFDLSDELPADASVWQMPSDIQFRAVKEHERADGITVLEDATVKSVITYQVERKV